MSNETYKLVYIGPTTKWAWQSWTSHSPDEETSFPVSYSSLPKEEVTLVLPTLSGFSGEARR